MGFSRLLTFLTFTAASAVGKEAPVRVQFDVQTDKGPGSFVIRVEPDWAPIGAARFLQLVKEKFYDDIRFFRVIPGFMVQFGLSGDPKLNKQWRSDPIKDEPVKKSNLPGYISFAKTGAPNSRTTQVFINYGDNGRLDGMGFAPFGEIEGGASGAGMEVVKSIHNIGEKPNQGEIQEKGNKYLDKSFPELSKVISAKILEGDAKGDL